VGDPEDLVAAEDLANTEDLADVNMEVLRKKPMKRLNLFLLPAQLMKKTAMNIHHKKKKLKKEVITREFVIV
jgi:hypothetical protein